MLGLSIILYTALSSGKSCEQVFETTARVAVPSIKEEEHGDLKELAKAACTTTNPDIIWQIAYQESSFRFNIVRLNSKAEAQVLEGSKARSYLRELKKSQQRINADLGVLQVNWVWHRQHFANNPLRMLRPKEQVKYLANSLGDSLSLRCSSRWVACYHHAGNNGLGERYLGAVQKKGQKLQLIALNYLKSVRDELSPEENKLLPLVNKRQFYAVLSSAKAMPLPEIMPAAYKQKPKLFVDDVLSLPLKRESDTQCLKADPLLPRWTRWI